MLLTIQNIRDHNLATRSLARAIIMRAFEDAQGIGMDMSGQVQWQAANFLKGGGDSLIKHWSYLAGWPVPSIDNIDAMVVDKPIIAHMAQLRLKNAKKCEISRKNHDIRQAKLRKGETVVRLRRGLKVL